MLRSLTLFLLLIFTLSGCVSTPPAPLFRGEVAECERALQTFYRDVESSRDFSLPYHHDPRFPHLAFDRFSTSLTPELTDAAAQAQWLVYVSDLGQQQLATALLLSDVSQGTSQARALLQCQASLVDASIEQPVFWRTLKSAPPEVPTAYEHWKRVLGVYPVAKHVAKPRIEKEQRRIASAFGRTLETPVSYGEPGSDVAPVHFRHIMADAKRFSSLNWPLLTRAEEQLLLDRFSPLFQVETRSADDLPGALKLDAKNAPYVDTKTPALYRAVTYTRFDGQVLPQLNYTLWFSARTAKAGWDPYAGEFDAVLIRITLDENGNPLILDSIHQCGCYHMVYALDGALRFVPNEDEKPIASYLLTPWQKGRFTVSLTAGEHMISGVSVTDNIAPQVMLTAQPSQATLILSAADQSLKSPFDRHGILPQSLRSERWFLWPFGVRSPGAMRQVGRHAIAFIGERHFDDAFLFEQLVQRRGGHDE